MNEITPVPDTIRGCLSAGEQVIWHGQPRQGLRLRSSDWFAVPFSLLWGGFAIFWEGSVISSNAPPFFALWGIPFVLVGLYMIAGRFFVNAWQRKRTHYALTGERVLIASGATVQSLDLRTLTNLSLTESRDGSGTISTGAASGRMGMGSFRMPAGWPGARAFMAPQLEMIAGARRVYQLIREAQQRI